MTRDASQPAAGLPDDQVFGDLVVRYLDGLCDDAETTRLIEQLGDSDDAVQTLVTLSVQRRILRESLQYSASRTQIRELSGLSSPQQFAARPRRWWIGSLAAAAAIVALCVTMWSIWATADKGSSSQSIAMRSGPVGTVTTMRDVQRGPTGEPLIAGQTLNQGAVSLNAGSMQLVTTAGVTLTFDGPGEFEMIDPMHAFVRRGTMIAIAPADVTGFTIQTQRLRIRDLGTEFGVHVDESGAIDLEVLDGRVEVVTLDTGGQAIAQRVLTRWQAVRFDPDQSDSLIDVAPMDSLFADRRVMRDGFPGVSRHGRPAAPIRLDRVHLAPYANQDGYNGKPTRATLLEDGAVCQLQGNSWKSIAVDYDVTEKTILEAEYRTIHAGEMIGVGVDNDDNVKSDETMFALAGSNYKAPGVRSDYRQASSADWKTIRIRLGDHTRGLIRQLVIFADDDAHGRALGEFRNLRLYEPADPADKTHPLDASISDDAGENQSLRKLEKPE